MFGLTEGSSEDFRGFGKYRFQIAQSFVNPRQELVGTVRQKFPVPAQERAVGSARFKRGFGDV